MLTKSPQITLLAPGCFSAVAPTEQAAPSSIDNKLAVELNQSEAISTNTNAFEQALAAAFMQHVPDMGALPAADYQYPIDTGESAPEHCVCMELIHFQADKDNARLLPQLALDISDDECEQLLSSLTQLIAEDGLSVFRAASGRCYLTGMPTHALDTWPAHAVANGKIANYLPRQSDAGDWRRFLTEVQMLFHAHPVNTLRAEQRKLPINGMWFWGGIKGTQLTPVTGYALFADDAYSRGFCAALNKASSGNIDGTTVELSGTKATSWAELEQSSVLNGQIEHIVIVNHHVYDAWLRGDHASLHDAKQQLNDQWILPIQHAISQGLVSEFVLDGCEGQAIVERRANALRARFGVFGWLKKLPMRGFMSNHDIRVKK